MDHERQLHAQKGNIENPIDMTGAALAYQKESCTACLLNTIYLSCLLQ